MSLVDNDTRVIRKKKNPRAKMEGGVTISRQHWNEEAVGDTGKTMQVWVSTICMCPVAVLCFGFKEAQHHHVAGGLNYIDLN